MLKGWVRITTIIIQGCCSTFHKPIDESHSLEKKVLETYQNFVVNFIKDGGTGVHPLKKTLEAFLDEKRVRNLAVDYGLVTMNLLRESVQTLASRRVQAKLASGMIAEFMRTQSFKYSAASLTVLPETFLAGIYLAASDLL